MDEMGDAWLTTSDDTISPISHTYYTLKAFIIYNNTSLKCFLGTNST